MNKFDANLAAQLNARLRAAILGFSKAHDIQLNVKYVEINVFTMDMQAAVMIGLKGDLENDTGVVLHFEFGGR